jgi:hypothetical protein
VKTIQPRRKSHEAGNRRPWSRYVDQSQWQREGKDQVLEIAGFVIAIGPGIDVAGRHVWRWSIYRGKAEWYSYLVEGGRQLTTPMKTKRAPSPGRC